MSARTAKKWHAIAVPGVAASTRRIPRGRPTQAEGEAINRRVLDAAKTCFLTAGFDRTTMEAIAQHAGVTKVTLYLRYPDRIAILKAVIEDRRAVWSAIAARTNWMLGNTLEQRLRHYAATVLDWSRNEEIRAFRRLIAGCWGEAREAAEELQSFMQAPMVELLEREISALGGRQGRPVDCPRHIAVIFLGMLGSFGSLSPEERADDAARRRYAAKIVDIFLKGQAGW
jgi:AcrR family transcriptional regulator